MCLGLRPKVFLFALHVFRVAALTSSHNCFIFIKIKPNVQSAKTKRTLSRKECFDGAAD
jgi:hypothetical protein